MINFLKYKYIYFIISGIVIVPGLISLVLWGLKPAIDFTGGTVWELKFSKNVAVTEVKKYFDDSKTGELVSISTVKPNDLSLKLKPLTEERKTAIAKDLNSKFGTVADVSFETVGALLGSELLTKTAAAIILAAFLIMAYIVYRFHDRLFGVAAIAAMLHDTLVILGVFSILGHFFGIQVDTLYVTAVLTILSFSTHDTVVVYDRIRELTRVMPGKSLPELVNTALNETSVRSLNNSLTIIFMLLALVLLGGDTIRVFAIALLVGTISGTYSSMFTASPILVIWHDFLARQKLARSK